MGRFQFFALGGAILSLFAFGAEKAWNAVLPGPTVTLAVQASDTSGGTLHYMWKATDGAIADVDAASTTWTLPAGTGLHFAYVLVSNGLGGYVERRIAVNTDSLASGPAAEHFTANAYVAPAAPAEVGDYTRGRLVNSDDPGVDPDYFASYVPNLRVYLKDTNTNLRYPATTTVTTDAKGEFVIPGVPAGANFTVTCIDGGLSAPQCHDNQMPGYAFSQYLDGAFAPLDKTGAVSRTKGLMSGRVTLADGTPCGTQNEFFGVHSTATVYSLDAANNTLESASANEFGDYSLLFNPLAKSVMVYCEGATPVRLASPAHLFNSSTLTYNSLPAATISNVTTPQITTITASLQGQMLAPPVAIFLPPASNVPSDANPRADVFLAEKGLDSRLGACKYYQAIGAVTGCDSSGGFRGPINYKTWQRAVQIGAFAVAGGQTASAAYINKVDLNLARVHKSITYGPNQTAAVVCNHLGAADFFNPTQAEIDAAVTSAVQGKNLVACVAMDYMISPGVNNDQPFIRFLIFGPNGDLLPSINLDGRREKFVPGTCVVCHGGDHYAGKFPENGSGFANVGGHFLPYDLGNFEFASTKGRQKCDEEDAIYQLNQNVLQAGPTGAEQELIGGWYATPGPGGCAASSVMHALNEAYIPSSWASQDSITTDFYQNVMARSCRTCHVAMVEPLNFDHFDNILNYSNQLPDPPTDIQATMCPDHTQRKFTMPNSLITFNRFWLTQNNTVGLPDQVLLTQQFENDVAGNNFCTLQGFSSALAPGAATTHAP